MEIIKDKKFHNSHITPNPETQPSYKDEGTTESDSDGKLFFDPAEEKNGYEGNEQLLNNTQNKT